MDPYGWKKMSPNPRVSYLLTRIPQLPRYPTTVTRVAAVYCGSFWTLNKTGSSNVNSQHHQKVTCWHELLSTSVRL